MTSKAWRANYDDGHYATLIGFSKEVIFFEDPSSFHRTWLKENAFLARWHDKDPHTGERLERFGMVLLKKEPVGRLLRPMG